MQLSKNSANQDGDEQAGSRKRNLKFSEKEIEILIDECYNDHDLLFGKPSITVSQGKKKKIWLYMEAGMNAVGVMQCSLKEIGKCWYNLMLRTREKVATRLPESRATVRGPSRVLHPTDLETLVEGILEPETVVGFGQIDTSTSGPDPSPPQGTPSIEQRQGEVHGPHPQQEPASDTAGPSRTPPGSMEDPTQDMEAAGIAPVPSPTERRTEPADGAVRRRRRRVHSVHRDNIADVEFVGLEASLIQGQRLQNRQLRSINRNLN
ncbi:myb-related transcription factor, partner of profilin-like [Pleurodeles waltl]|uniref:myb-related transcription factor, partner of profilin-like n=1 Tax=Pleurodeles waltl TaxID=8319 RepID=UPI003709C563